MQKVIGASNCGYKSNYKSNYQLCFPQMETLEIQIEDSKENVYVSESLITAKLDQFETTVATVLATMREMRGRDSGTYQTEFVRCDKWNW